MTATMIRALLASTVASLGLAGAAMACPPIPLDALESASGGTATLWLASEEAPADESDPELPDPELIDPAPGEDEGWFGFDTPNHCESCSAVLIDEAEPGEDPVDEGEYGFDTPNHCESCGAVPVDETEPGEEVVYEGEHFAVSPDLARAEGAETIRVQKGAEDDEVILIRRDDLGAALREIPGLRVVPAK